MMKTDRENMIETALNCGATILENKDDYVKVLSSNLKLISTMFFNKDGSYNFNKEIIHEWN